MTRLLPVEPASDEAGLLCTPAPPPAPRRIFRGVKAADCPPAEALGWSSKREKGRVLVSWREAILARFARESRTIRLAWTIESLVGLRGYAFPGDTWLAAKAGLRVKKLQARLTKLERA